MRPVLFMKREVVQGLSVQEDLHSPKIWKNPMIAEKLLQAGFVISEELIICYVCFADDYAFIGKERGNSTKTPSTNTAATNASGS